MLQDCNYPWKQPPPLPLVNRPADDQNVVLSAEDRPAAPALPAQEPPPLETPLLFLDDEYQWMMLL